MMKIIKSFLLFTMAFLGVNFNNISAIGPTQPIQNYPGVEIASGTSEIAAEYSFSPKITKDTEIIPTVDSNNAAEVNGEVVTISPTNGEDKPYGEVLYTNVGEYNGNKVDVVVSATSNNTSKLSIYMIGASITAAKATTEADYDSVRVNTRANFYISGTKVLLNVKGYFSMEAINSNKIVTINENLFQNSATKLVTNDSIIVYDDNIDFTGTTTSLASDSMVTLTYDTIFRLSFDAYSSRPLPVGGVIAVKIFPKSLAKIETPVPRKEGYTVEKGFEEKSLLYDITQDVPSEEPEWYFNNFKIEDDINPALDVAAEDIIVKDHLGVDQTGKFDISIDGNNHLIVNAKAGSLSSASFYNVSYIVSIIGQVNPDADFTSLIEGELLKIENKVATTINDVLIKESELAHTFIEKVKREVKFVDEDGNSLEQSETVSGFPGDEYETTSKEINLYNLIETPANANGDISVNMTDIIYVYKLKPIITANDVTYIAGQTKDEAQFFIDSDAKTNDNSEITSNFATEVDLNIPGDYTVTIKSADAETNKADEITVVVHVVAKTVISANDVTYIAGQTKDEAQFFIDSDAKTNNNTEITSNFATEVDLNIPGDYTVTIKSADAETNKADEITVVVHVVAKTVISANDVTYIAGQTKDEAQFFIDSDAKTNNNTEITSNFATEVDLNIPGDYTVTIKSADAETNKADEITVVVHVVAKTVISANDVTYIAGQTKDEAQFFIDSDAKTNNNTEITSNFATEVDLNIPGDYTVTIKSADAETNKADEITVVVHVVAKTVISANDVTYIAGQTKDEAQFFIDSDAKTNDNSEITSNFATEVDLNIPGDYTVTIKSADAETNKADEITVVVHVVAKTVISANDVTYIEGQSIDEAQFFIDSDAKTNNNTEITSNFATEVDLNTPEDYTVTIKSVDTETNKADEITVVVHVLEKPVISANDVTYTAGNTVDEAKFFVDSHAKSSDNSEITSNFATEVDMNTPGDYTVTIKSADSVTNKADEITVVVHVLEKPIISANDVTYIVGDTIDEAKFFVDSDAKSSDNSGITSDFVTAVDLNTVGDYTVTIKSVDSVTKKADEITVIVHVVAKTVITANDITYIEGQNIDEDQFFIDSDAKTNNNTEITSNFATEVDLNTPGDYTVTIKSVDTETNKADEITVVVHVVAKTVISANDVTYIEGQTVDESKFFSDSGAKTNNNTEITSNFASVVDLNTPGDYTVTIKSVDTETNKAEEITVVVHVLQKPIITGKNVTYKVNQKISETDYLKDSKAKASDGSKITSNFASVVNMNKIGKYIVTIKSADSVTNKAESIEIIVYVVKNNESENLEKPIKPQKPAKPIDRLPDTGNNYVLLSLILFSVSVGGIVILKRRN